MSTMNLRRCCTRTANKHVVPPPDQLLSTEERNIKKSLAKKHINLIKQEALQALLKLRASNGGHAKYGDIPYIVKQYHNMGYTYVTRGVLCYMLSERNHFPVASVSLNRSSVSSSSNISLLTSESIPVGMPIYGANDQAEYTQLHCNTKMSK
jgi:hypothetical protein